MAGKRLLDSGRAFDVSHDPAYIWQDDAACAFTDPKIFEPVLRGEPEGLSLNNDQIRAINVKNFNQAKALCNGCPVFNQCESTATDADFKYIFRAGRVPLVYSGSPVGRPRKVSLIKVKPKGKKCMKGDRLPLRGACKNGHQDEWITDRRGVRICQPCRRNSTNRYYSRKKPSRQPATHCVKGTHLRTEENTYTSPGGRKRCRPCKGEYEAAKYAAKKVATLVS